MRLLRDYLASGGRLQSRRQRRIVEATIAYAAELADSYASCLQPASGTAPVTLVAALAARGIRARTLQLRWTLLHYAAPEASLWRGMHSLFADCERLGIDAVRFKLYEAMATESTIRREYLRALMLAVSAVAGLLPTGQAAAERVIASLSEYFVIHHRPNAACHFVVDLRSAWSPQRRFDRSLEGEHLRFFGAGDAVAKLRAWAQEIEATGRVPAEAGLGGYEPALVHEVLLHLERHWGPAPPRRQHERVRILRTLHVARGFDAACRALADREPLPGDARTTESWTTEDESATGFGAFLKMREGDDFAVGDLVAARGERPGPWRIGVIRRLSTRDNGYHSLGVQVLAFGALRVDLVPAYADATAETTLAALLVPAHGSPAHGLEVKQPEVVLLVLPATARPRGSSWRMLVHEQMYLLRDPEVDEVGGDYQTVRFIVSKAPSEG